MIKDEKLFSKKYEAKHFLRLHFYFYKRLDCNDLEQFEINILFYRHYLEI